MSQCSVRRLAVALAVSAAVLTGSGCTQLVTTGQVPMPKVGTNLLAGAEWEYSIDRCETWSKSPPILRGGEKAAIYLRVSFDVTDPSSYASLELTHGVPDRTRMLFRLNDEPVLPPLRGMYYKTIPAIPTSLLKAGANVLTGKIGFDNRPPSDEPETRMPDVRVGLAPCLFALAPRHLRITSGPVLGAVEDDHFSATCRTNMPARVVLYGYDLTRKRAGFVAESRTGLAHRFRIPRAAPDPNGLYLLVADNGRGAAAEVIRAPAYPTPDEPLRFVAMGDSRTNLDDWAAVANAALNAKLQLVVFSGDMVSRGRNDWEWDEQFFAPAKELFLTIPFYAVIGNHEENAPVYPELFYTPSPDGRATNWAQEINGVLLIGIDGQEDWSAESVGLRKLEKTLKESQAKFIFLFSHYPAWSSSSHGRLREETGLPREAAVRQARQTIVPLLRKYKAAAYICGHEHCYERSELPGGVSHVISGGAGAPLRQKMPTAAAQNPYSVTFASKLHYCLFEVTGDTCTMKALTPDGSLIDRRSWDARKVK